MSRPPATSRKVRRVLVLPAVLALFLACRRATQTARALLGAGAVPFPRSVPPGIWAHNLLVARRAKADGTFEAKGNENDKGPSEPRDSKSKASEKDQDKVEEATIEAKASFDQAGSVKVSRNKAVDEAEEPSEQGEGGDDEDQDVEEQAASVQTKDLVEDAKKESPAKAAKILETPAEKAEGSSYKDDASLVQQLALALAQQGTAQEQVKTAQAQVETAQAQVKTAQAQVDMAVKNLGKANAKLEDAERRGDTKKVKEAKEEVKEAKEEVEKVEQKVEKAEQKVEKAKEEVEKAEQKVEKAKEEVEKAEQKVEKAKAESEAKASSSTAQAIRTVSEKDLQNLANISGPNVTIEDWMVGLGRCGKECLKDIQANAPKSDSPVDRVPPLMLSRCMRGGKTTFLVYLFELVKAEPGYLPIFISFNGYFGIRRKRGESRLQTILRAIAVALLPATPTDPQCVSCDEDTLCDHLERQNGIIVLMIDELNLLMPKGTTDDEVASFLRRVFLSRENRYLVFTTHEPFDGSQFAEYTGGKFPYSPRGVVARDLPRSVNVTEQRGIPQCRAISAGNVLFFSGIPALLRSWKTQYDFQARFEQLTKPKKTPGLLESFVREVLDGRRQSGDAIRAFDCLTATSDRVDVKWILCYAAQMCSYLNQLELADWINRLQMDASDPLSGKGWEMLVVLAAAFRCLEAMARGYAGHPLLGLPPKPNIKACYFWDVPSEVSTLDEALEWWAGQDIAPTFPFVAVLNPLCSTFEVFDCILLYQRSKLSVLQVRGFQQKAGRTYPDKAAHQDVDSVWLQGKAAENRRSEQAKGWTLPSAGEIRAFLGASLRDLFPKELDT